MVLEQLVSPARARREPQDLLVVSALFVSFGVLVQIFLPTVRGSAIVFAMIPAIPLVWSLVFREERMEEKELIELVEKKYNFFTHHKTLIEVFSFFFLGAVIAYAFWYAVLPPDLAKLVFSDQISELKSIQASVTNLVTQAGSVHGESVESADSVLQVNIGLTGFLVNQARFWLLFYHNLQVLALMFLFCLLYGIGSVYMLLWNASIIGVVVGKRIQTEGFTGLFTGIASLLPHGIFEVTAYFIASIAGGVLSMSIAHRHHNKQFFRILVLDVFTLAIISLILLTIGAFIESAY